MNEDDREKLRSYCTVLDEAMRDVDDFYKDGYMSDLKSAVYALPRKVEALGLSDAAVSEELVALAKNCWHAMYDSADGGSDSFGRAGRAAGAIGVLERRIQALLDGPSA